MRKDKIRAYELRRQQKSYSEISKALSVPKSTLASWFKKEAWSSDISKALGEQYSFSSSKNLARVRKANKLRWENERIAHRKAAEIEFKELKKDPLFLAGIMLYWGEGDKTERSMVKFANSDPRMISVFYNFLKKSLKIPEGKVSAYLLLYPDLNDSMQKRFWQRATGIPAERFWKSVFIKGKHPTRRLSYGVCNINLGSRAIKERLLVWIDLYQKELA